MFSARTCCCGRLGHAPAGAVSARRQPRALPVRLRRLPRDASRPRPEARAQRPLQLAWLQPDRTGARLPVLQGTGRPGLPAVPDHRDPAREPVLRRLVRRELGELVPTATRCQGTHSSHREALPRHRAGMGAFHVRGIDGRMEAMARRSSTPTSSTAPTSLPDPIDFRAYTTVNLYEDANAYDREGPGGRWPARPPQLPGPCRYDHPRHEHAGTGARRQRAVRRPVGHLAGGLLASRADGYPKPIFDKRTGVIDRDVPATGVIATTCPTSCGATGRNSAEAARESSTSTWATWTLLPQQRGLPRGGVPQDAKPAYEGRSTTATGPSTAGTATHEAQRHVATAYHQMFAPKISSGCSRPRRRERTPPVGDTDHAARAALARRRRRRAGDGGSDEDELTRSFRHLHMKVYGTMQGPNEFVVNGTFRDWDAWPA